MCIILVKRAGIPIPEDLHNIIDKAIRYNGDGCGYAIRKAKTGGIIFDRGLYDTSDILMSMEEAELKEEDELLFHARISTRGDVSLSNCHPFPIIDGNWKTPVRRIKKEVTSVPFLAHNGWFHNIPYLQSTQKMSDTNILCKDYVNKFDLLESDEGEEAILDYLRIYSSNSKIATLHPQRGLKLFGNFVEDCVNKLVFSNSSLSSATILNPRDMPELRRVTNY